MIFLMIICTKGSLSSNKLLTCLVIDKSTQRHLGGVHKIRLQDLAFFDTLPPSVYISYGIKVYKKLTFLTTYPPPLVNVVCERPLIQKYTRQFIQESASYLVNGNINVRKALE